MEEHKFIIADSGNIVISILDWTVTIHAEDPMRPQVLEAINIGDWEQLIKIIPKIPLHITNYLDTFKLGGAL